MNHQTGQKQAGDVAQIASLIQRMRHNGIADPAMRDGIITAELTAIGWRQDDIAAAFGQVGA